MNTSVKYSLYILIEIQYDKINMAFNLNIKNIYNETSLELYNIFQISLFYIIFLLQDLKFL